MSMFANEAEWDQFRHRYFNNLRPDGPSPFAELIASGRYNSDQLGEIFSRAIGRENPLHGHAILGNDAFVIGTAPAAAGRAPSAADRVVADQAVIAPALDAAFRGGHVTARDLMAFGRSYGEGGIGEARVAALLGRHDSGPGGAAEAYALALLDQHYPRPRSANDPQPTDPETIRGRGLAYSLLANDPALRERHFGSGGEIPARHAFETLVRFNDANPYNPRDGFLASGTAGEGLRAAATLYRENATSFLDHYSGANGRDPAQMPELARFWAQSTINPYARDLQLPAQPPGTGTVPLHTAVNGATHAYVEGLAGQLTALPNNSTPQQDVVHQLAAIQAGIRVATDLELSRYQNGRAEREAIQGWFTAAGAELAGAVPVSRVPLASDALRRGGGAVGGWLGGMFTGDPPPAPDVSGSRVTHGAIYDRVGQAERERPDMMAGGRANLQESLMLQADSFTRQFIDGIQRATGVPVTRIHAEAAAPDGVRTALMSDPDHPGHARFAACRDGCAGTGLALGPAELTALASTVAVRTREEGLPRVDHIVPSANGQTVFAVAGRLDDPAHLRVAVPVDEGRSRSIEENSVRLAALEIRQGPEARRELDPSLDPEVAQRGAIRMA